MGGSETGTDTQRQSRGNVSEMAVSNWGAQGAIGNLAMINGMGNC